MMRATKGGVHGMSGALGNHMSERGAAEQREIADEVQRFVPATFIGGAQAIGIQWALAGETDRISSVAPRIRPICASGPDRLCHPNVRAKADSEA